MKRHLLLPIALLLVAAAWVTGCGREPIPNVPRDTPSAAAAQAEESNGIGEATPTRTAVPTVAPPTDEAEMTPTPAPTAAQVELQDENKGVVRRAKEDLAQRLGLDGDRIWLVSVEAVQWSDASLGCPKPGTMYAQVITPGFKVVLEAEGQVYEYHTDAAQSVVLCGADGWSIDPVPLMPVAPHGKQPPKPRRRAH